MNKLITAALLSLITAIPSMAQSSVNRFRFQPQKIAVGTVYHYLKTNEVAVLPLGRAGKEPRSANFHLMSIILI